MSQAAIVARVTVRDLWMTFRLLVVLVVFVGTSAIVVLLPATPTAILERLAIGLAVATVAAAAVAAWTMADERTSGRAGWLVTRSVSRSTYVIGLFGGLAAIATGGVVASVLLGWTTTFNLPARIEVPAMFFTMLAVATTVSAAIALGLACGALLPPVPAAVVAAIVSVAIGSVGLLGAWIPALALADAAFVLVADMLESPTIVPDAIRIAGVGMVATAIGLVVASVALERAEL